ncbi:MAG: hypothetical protein JNL11_19200 [Bdellovibrionaceae bacterium]|nr:hypothetical protein [Pseudobdellovibrionaceae bacterium]
MRFLLLPLVFASIISLAQNITSKTETVTKMLPVPSSLPEKCQKKWTMALSKDAPKVIEFFDYLAKEDPKNECLQHESKYLSTSLLELFDRTCKIQIPGDCINLFLYYRASVIDQLHEDDSEDTKVIYNKVVAGVLSKKFESGNKLERWGFAETRLEMIEKIRPKIKDDSSLDLNAITYIALNCMEFPSSCSKSEVTKSLNDIKGRRKNDPNIDQAIMIVLTERKDFANAKKFLDETICGYSALGKLAIAQWKAYLLANEGKKMEAKKVLKEQLGKNQVDNKVIETLLKNIDSPDKFKNLIPIRLNGSFNTTYI